MKTGLPTVGGEQVHVGGHSVQRPFPSIHFPCFYLGNSQSNGCPAHQGIIPHLGDGTLKTGNRILIPLILILNDRRPVLGHASEGIIIILRKCEKSLLRRIGLHARLNKARTSLRLILTLL